ncbi:hypothetical protein Taro_008338 [Colocasia esculenta]|uniref:Uncharacterized protein n=1 Tax=Colocasia esculenta TaxID=4460 RepID=A0A843U1L1_COLES|nr:hypothetical protein [Colocasia esculenta]
MQVGWVTGHTTDGRDSKAGGLAPLAAPLQAYLPRRGPLQKRRTIYAQKSAKGRLIVISLEKMPTPDDSSLAIGSNIISSQTASPFHESIGYATEQLSSSSLCSSPDDNSYDGFEFDKMEVGQLRAMASLSMPGVVLSVCSYLDRFVLASAGSSDLKKLEQLYCDPVQRLVADSALIDPDTAVVSDWRGNISILSSPNDLEDNASPECNLRVRCSYYTGETIMSIRKC